MTEIIPLVFCIIFYKKLNTKALKVFFIYCIALSILSTLSVISLYVIKSQLLYLTIIRFYVVFEYTIFSIFFYKILNNPIPQKIVLYSIFPFIFYSIYDYSIGDKNTFSSNTLIVEFLAFMIFIIYFFYEKMQTVVFYPLYQTITFWICVGLFLYFTGNFFFLLLIKSTNDIHVKIQMKTLYSFVTITKNIFLSVALLASEISEGKNDNIEIPDYLDLDDFSFKKS